jgi:hypothetical protein
MDLFFSDVKNPESLLKITLMSLKSVYEQNSTCLGSFKIGMKEFLD